jgi:hypothetical protein
VVLVKRRENLLCITSNMCGVNLKQHNTISDTILNFVKEMNFYY